MFFQKTPTERISIALFLLLTSTASFAQTQNEPGLSGYEQFGKEVEKLRIRYNIPSLSIGIVNKGELVWYGGFGFADIEAERKPDEHTVYHLASLSKTFASIILMQLVEQGKVSLDDPVTRFNTPLYGRWGGDDRIKVKHLLTHTAQGNSFNTFKPGYSFRYNGDFFGKLIHAIEQSSGKNYATLFFENIVTQTKLEHTFANFKDSTALRLTNSDRHEIESKTAKGYDFHKGKFVPVEYPSYFGPSAGVMSCVADLAKYSVAIDRGEFISPENWARTFSATVSEKGRILPYGLGWFVREYEGEKVLWHTGWWVGNSSLLVKVPGKDLTLIVLANSQDLSRPFYPRINPFNPKLGRDLMKSAFAKAFFETVVVGATTHKKR